MKTQDWKAQYKLTLEQNRTSVDWCNLTVRPKADLDVGNVWPIGSGFHLAPAIPLSTQPLMCQRYRHHIYTATAEERRSPLGILQEREKSYFPEAPTHV